MNPRIMTLGIVAAAAIAPLGGCGADHETLDDSSIRSDALHEGEGNHWGNSDFYLMSPEFEDGADLPDAHSCEGKPFGEGTSPNLKWSKGPTGTKTYALAFIDETILSTPQFAYHYAAWNIPHSVHEIPEAMEAGQFPEALKGCEQRRAGPPGTIPSYFGPCPSWQTLCFGAPRSKDSYAFRLYAFEEKELTPPTDGTMEALVLYLEEHAEAMVELTATSDAAPSSFERVCPDAG